MDYHLERTLRLHTEPEHKSLYKRAINEFDADGKALIVYMLGEQAVAVRWSHAAPPTLVGLGNDPSLSLVAARHLLHATQETLSERRCDDHQPLHNVVDEGLYLR